MCLIVFAGTSVNIDISLQLGKCKIKKRNHVKKTGLAAAVLHKIFEIQKMANKVF